MSTIWACFAGRNASCCCGDVCREERLALAEEPLLLERRASEAAGEEVVEEDMLKDADLEAW